MTTTYDVGMYTIVAPAVMTQTEDRMSEKIDRQLQPGDKVRVTRVMEKDDRIRAQLEGGGWISIESTCKKRWVWAEPMSAKDFAQLDNEKMFEGTILFNQIWVPAIIYSKEVDGELKHNRAVIRASKEMQEGGHANKEVRNLKNEHVRVEKPITPSQAEGSYNESDVAGRVQPPVSLGDKKGDKKSTSGTPTKKDTDVEGGKKPKSYRRNFFCALTACQRNPYADDEEENRI